MWGAPPFPSATAAAGFDISPKSLAWVCALEPRFHYIHPCRIKVDKHMRSWSIPVGRLFGVDVRLHLTFLILPMFIIWMDYTVRKENATGQRDLAVVGILLACVGAHELAHMLAARRLGMIPKAVILLPLTGVALYDESRAAKPQPAAQLRQREVRLALVGPLASFALACLTAGIVTASGHGNELWKWPFLQATNLPKSLVWANLYLTVLNLMPAYPLDGGRILRAFFSRTL